MKNIFDTIREEAGFQTACEIAKNLSNIKEEYSFLYRKRDEFHSFLSSNT